MTVGSQHDDGWKITIIITTMPDGIALKLFRCIVGAIQLGKEARFWQALADVYLRSCTFSIARGRMLALVDCGSTLGSISDRLAFD